MLSGRYRRDAISCKGVDCRHRHSIFCVNVGNVMIYTLIHMYTLGGVAVRFSLESYCGWAKIYIDMKHCADCSRGYHSSLMYMCGRYYDMASKPTFATILKLLFSSRGYKIIIIAKKKKYKPKTTPLVLLSSKLMYDMLSCHL